MSKTIDERVVEMRFDNKQFESNAKESIGTLAKLREALESSTKESSKSLDGLDKAAKNVSLEGIAAGVEALQKRFSTLGIIGMRVIENITDSMMNTLGRGINFVSDSIVSGGIRRAMNLENAHFQLQALLKDEVKVQEVMANANSAVDGTAYALDEAAKAASQFAASGIQAGDEMTNALRGVVGVAAMTNSDFESISRIFTTVAGNGRLMGDQLLQLGARGLNAAATIADFVNGVRDGSKEASDEVKALVKNFGDGVKVTEGDIRELVSDGQISFRLFSESMTEAFADSAERANETFTGALSNIKSALARIGAGFISPLIAQNSEVVDLFNAVRERINDVKKALVFDEQIGNVNALSKQFTDAVLWMAKGTADFIRNVDLSKPMEIFYYWVESVKNVGKGLYSVLKPLGQAFADVFLSFSIDDVTNLSAKIEKVTSNMKLTERGSKELKDAFKGVFDIVKLLGDGFLALLRTIIPIGEPITSLGDGILRLSGYVGRSLSQFAEWVRNSDVIAGIYNRINSGVTIASHGLKLFIDKISDLIRSIKDFPLMTNIIEGVNKALINMSGFLGKIETRFKPFNGILDLFFGIINSFGPTAVSILNGLGNVISFVLESISKALGSAGFNSILDVFNFSILIGVGTQFSKLLENINKTVTSAGGLFSGFTGTVKNITKTFQELQTRLKADTLKQIAISLALVVGSMFVLSMIDSEKLSSSLGAVTILLLEMTVILDHLNTFDKKAKKIETSGLIALSFAVLILVSSLKKISEIDSDRLVDSLGIITVLLGEMTAVAIVLSKYGGKIKTGSLNIIAFSTSILILTKAVKSLGDIDPEKLIQGLVSVGILMGELASFMVVAKFGKFKPSQGLAIIELSAALLILQKAVEGFGNIDIEVLIRGISAVGAVLAEISIFTLAAGESKHIISTSTSLVIIAQALKMLEGPMKEFGSMSLEEIGRGLLAIGGSLAEITIAMKLMPKNALTIGVGLLAVAEALMIIKEAVIGMASMTWDEIGRGLVVLAGSLAVLVVSMNLMKGTLGASAAMLVMAAALAVFTPVLKSLGNMTWDEIGRGLVVLGGAFAIVAAAGLLLGPIIPSILGLSAALALLGVAVAAAGVGILALSVGFTTLAASGIVGAVALVEVIKTLITGVIDTIRESAEAFGEMVKSLVLTICDVIKECVPEIVETVLIVIQEVLTALADNGPSIVHELLRLIIGIIDALAVDMPTVVQSVVNLFMQFFSAIIEALNSINIDVLVEGIKGIGLIAALMLALAGLSALAPEAMIGVLAMGAVIAELAILLAAIGALSQIPGLNWLIGEGGKLLQGVGTAIGNFVGGIVGGFMSGISSEFPKIATDLSDFMTNISPFLEGASGINSGVMDGVLSLAKVIILLTAADILQGLTSWLTGGSSIVKFGEELEEFAPHFAAYAVAIKGIDAATVEASANAALALSEMANKLPNSGGLAAKIFGDNSLAEFGQELKEFGPHLATYAETIKDVNPEVVEASANAAQVMADMATTLPNSGGLAAKIFGDNTLSSFGEELSKFGPYLADYAESISGVNAEVVTNSANAAKALSELANGLPNTGGLVSWFTGDNDIGTFGDSLVTFGKGMKSYYDSISGIEISKLDGVVEEVKKLIDIANGTASLDTSGMTRFASSLEVMGNNGITAFIAAFNNSIPAVTSAVQTMITSAINSISLNDERFKVVGTTSANSWILGFKSKYLEAASSGKELATKVIAALQLQVPTFLTKGTASANQYLTGIKNKYGEATSTGTTLAMRVIQALQDKNSTFLARGTDSANQYLQGIKNKYGDATSVGNELADKIIQGLKDINSKFYDAGKDAGKGFADGLKSTTDLARSAGKAIGDAAYEAAKKSLDEHSPSKKMGEVGKYAGLGFVNGLVLLVAKAATAGEELGDEAVKGASGAIGEISRVITEDMISDPVIRPEVDLSIVKKSVADINEMFNRAIAITTINAGSISEIVSPRRGNVKNHQDIQNEKSGNIVQNFNFNQTNNSPKALSRIDIYRQTNNQFSRFKREVEAKI